MLFLLPLSIILSYARNPEISSPQYKLATLVSTGFVVSNIVIIIQCIRNNDFKLGVPHFLTAVYTSSLFFTCLHKGKTLYYDINRDGNKCFNFQI